MYLFTNDVRMSDGKELLDYKSRGELSDPFDKYIFSTRRRDGKFCRDFLWT